MVKQDDQDNTHSAAGPSWIPVLLGLLICALILGIEFYYHAGK